MAEASSKGRRSQDELSHQADDGLVSRVPDEPSERKSRARSVPLAGTRLIREWNGKTHVVDVGQDGFVYDGRTYRSLTAIALQITGVHWSGPRFFGL